MTSRSALELLLEHAREEVGRADSKASIVLAAAGVGLAAFLAGVVSGDWQPHDLPNRIEWLWWISAASFLLGIGVVAWCIWPSTEPKTADPLPSYYKRIADYGDPSLLRAAVDTADFDEILAEQLLAVSKIACDKYFKLQWGLGLLTSGGALMAVGLVVQSAW